MSKFGTILLSLFFLFGCSISRNFNESESYKLKEINFQAYFIQITTTFYTDSYIQTNHYFKDQSVYFRSSDKWVRTKYYTSDFSKKYGFFKQKEYFKLKKAEKCITYYAKQKTARLTIVDRIESVFNSNGITTNTFYMTGDFVKKEGVYKMIEIKSNDKVVSQQYIKRDIKN